MPSVTQLEVKQTIGTFSASGQAGAAVGVHRFPWKSVQFAGIGAGDSFQLQGSNDNVGWVALGDPVTADGFVDLQVYCHFVRVATTTHAGGNVVTATFAGLEPN
ncbi:MAG TPA: hypothetical protein VGQ83_26715 [Polyangia bacterium]|jgi:hypothetical protein